MSQAERSARAERKRMWAALAKAVHPVKLNEREQRELYDFAIAHRGLEGWTT